MQKKIMFIGAGAHQAKGIEKAKEMGLFVIAVDGSAKAPGLKIADQSHVIDVKDIKSNLNVAIGNQIDGILAVASEVSVLTVAAISQEMGLPGIDVEVAKKCTDKGLMRKAFVEHGVPSPKSYSVYSYEDLLKRADEIGYPLVIKPADNAGSRGVKMLRDQKEFKTAYNDALQHSKSGKLVIEEFMKGIEVSVEAFMHKGKINIIGLSDKVRSPLPYLLDIKVSFPSAYSEAEINNIINMARQTIEAVGVKEGPVHMELIMTKSGPIPVELAARGPGFKVFTDIMPMITGIDLLKELIRMSLGDKPSLEKRKDMASVIKFLDTKTGVLKRISGINQAKKEDGVYEVEIYPKEGDKVNKLTCGADRVGHIISIADTRRKAEEAVERAEKRIKLEVT